MSAKVIIAVAVFAFVVAMACGQSHHAQWGQRAPGDRLLWNSIEYQEFSPLQIVKRDVDFPPKGEANYAIITFINATDQYINGNGGYASLLRGGVNYNHTTIHLKSQRGHGFNFMIDIYGF